jgi:hypothetical protein
MAVLRALAAAAKRSKWSTGWPAAIAHRAHAVLYALGQARLRTLGALLIPWSAEPTELLVLELDDVGITMGHLMAPRLGRISFDVSP